MSTKHLVDPELIPTMETLPSFDFSGDGLAQARAFSTEMLKQMGELLPQVPGVTCREQMVPGPDSAPDVRVLIYTPEKGVTTKSAYLQIHGGGYVLGVADMGEFKNKSLVAEIGCVVVSVDYRLAPETPFPGPVEDCYAALKWLHANAASLGVDPNRIVIGGESAGGGLAAGLALLARDRGEVPIIHQQLIYPMIEDRAPSAPNPHTGEFVWTPENNVYGWTALLGHAPGGPDVSPHAAAARTADLKGLPPAFISVGTLDLFIDENLAYAQRLARAGVLVELHVYPGAFHGFDAMGQTRLGRMHARDQMEALRHALTNPANT